MKNYRLKILTAFVLTFGLLVLGCSTEKKSDSNNSTDTATAGDTLSDAKKIELSINEAMDRIRYKDKSYIYDMEFEYYKDEISFDEYLADRRIATVTSDTLTFVKVLDVKFLGQDTAVAKLEFHFKGPSGIETVKSRDNNYFYRRDGQWIKPTLSSIDRQRQYEEIQRQAKESAESESGK